MNKLNRMILAAALGGAAWVQASAQTVPLQNATATTAFLPYYPPSQAIDGITNGDQGWALTGGNAPATIVFETQTSTGFAGGSLLTFTLYQGDGLSSYPNYQLGRFRLSVTTDDRDTFADGLANGGDVTASWTVLEPATYSAANGATLTKQPDSSLLASGGANPTIDTIYTITAYTTLTDITGFRLETLTDPSLPNHGPGRAGNGNFIVQEFQVSIAPGVSEVPPTILAQPQGRRTRPGQTATFTVTAAGTSPLNYQWLSNGVALAEGGRITGAHSNVLTISALEVSDSAGYSVIVSNAFGSTNSDAANLLVTTNGLTLTWTGTVSSDWNDPANWNPPLVPDAADHIIINSGTVTVPASGAFAVMDWMGGYINGSLQVSAGAVFNWSGGDLHGTLSVAAAGQWNLSGNNDRVFTGPLTNAGTLTMIGTGRLIGYDADFSRLVNLSGGLVDLQRDDLPGNYCIYAFGGLDNRGVWRKSVGNGTSTLYQRLSNSGTVEALTGTLKFNGGGVIAGTFSAAAGAGINFAGGAFSNDIAPTLSGDGVFQFTGGSLLLANDVIPRLELVSGAVSLGPDFQGGSITNLTLPGASLTGDYLVGGTFHCGGGVSGNLRVNTGGVFTWSGGNLNGTLAVAAGGQCNLSGDNDRVFTGPLTNAGTLTMTGSGRLIGYDANLSRLVNLSGGLVDLQRDDAPPIPGNYCIYANGGIENRGVWRKSAGNGPSSLYQQFQNLGTVEALTGTINLQAPFLAGESSSLVISLGGPASGSGYGHLHFTSPPTFKGTFSVTTRNGYRPNPGDSFFVLSYPSATNRFVCMSGLDLGGGILLQPHYTPTSLTLTAAAYTPGAEPQLVISRWPEAVLVQWPLGFPGWTLQTTTNLDSPTWAPVAAQCDNQAFVPVSGTHQFFRLNNHN